MSQAVRCYCCCRRSLLPFRLAPNTEGIFRDPRHHLLFILTARRPPRPAAPLPQTLLTMGGSVWTGLPQDPCVFQRSCTCCSGCASVSAVRRGALTVRNGTAPDSSEPACVCINKNNNTESPDFFFFFCGLSVEPVRLVDAMELSSAWSWIAAPA